MRVVLLNNRLNIVNLPSKIDGSFALQDIPNSEEIIANIEGENNSWHLNTTNGSILNDSEVGTNSIKLEESNFYTINYNNLDRTIYVEDSIDTTFKMYKVSSNAQFVVGKNRDNQISYDCDKVLGQHLALLYKDNKWNAKVAPNATVYVNEDYVIEPELSLNNGDVIFIYGLRIILMNDTVIINNPYDKVKINSDIFESYSVKQDNFEYIELPEDNLYTEDDYFFKTPRLRRFIDTYKMKFANPPQIKKSDDTPLILVLGPSVTMALVSVGMLANMLIMISQGNSKGFSTIVRIVSIVAMLLSCLLWPNLLRKYNKKKDEKSNKERIEKYHNYLDKKGKEMAQEAVNQTEILKENLIPIDECIQIIQNKKRTLWERKISQRDFLTVRAGIGDIPLDIEIEFSEEEFSIEDDPLRIDAENLVNNYKNLKNVPVGYSFYNKKATAIMGIDSKLYPFTNNLILQLVTFHSYDDLKIIILTDQKNESKWEPLKNLPHCFSNNKEIRFFASNSDDMKNLSSYLEQEYVTRVNNMNDKSNIIENEDRETEATFSPYYLIFTDNFAKVRRLGISELILKNKPNLGFGFVIIENRLGKLPSECVNFITLGNQTSGILRNEVDDYEHQDFKDEIKYDLNLRKCCEVLANIPIEFFEDIRFLPKSIGFLEMLKVGKVEQLNTLNRWRLNDPTKSLRACIGVNDLGNMLYLDLHEKYHGPHGLIAGTTGSGKSEFIITYVLSMALNYSPNEVSFILIDYKGGGLAGAFENKSLKIRLPHLAGTITNLDKAELNRTLVSIESELRRRQKAFNEAREMLGESTIDIYKYQKYYRQKKISKPIPHLFIICDEFAELKAQQPEFMDNLISTARIGRSLGVHLILATQKPSGVVNDQIWSNTKFRVCLKVADRSDSNEMLKRPEAADLKEAGRFYLQVGNNELFLLGQSGWSGKQYEPSDTVNKEIDKSINYLDNIGGSIKDYDDIITSKVAANGDELSNVLKYVTTLASRENLSSPRLWLDNIPGTIYTETLINKYNYRSEAFKLETIIGEYDDPSNQYQDLLKIELGNEGNTLIYGTSGSNREMLLNTLIYSTCLLHTADEINFYIFDFGSETTRMFKNMPQVGDIVYASDDEKITKLNQMIFDEIEYRKNLFADYNGEYDNYCRNSGRTLPRKIFIYNNLDSYREMFPNCDEQLVKASREGLRYGIIIILLANSQTGLFGRLTRNFNNTLVLDMPTKDAYMTILGKIGNVYPASYDGRGLIKKDNVTYEFQTASIYPNDKLVEYIKSKIEVIKSISSARAQSIPVLPDVVTYEMLKLDEFTTKNVPLGIYKDTLDKCYYNFETDKGTIVTSNEIELLQVFINNLIVTFKQTNNIDVLLLDFENLLNSVKDDVNVYVNDKLEEYIADLNTKMESTYTSGKTMIIVFGLEKMKTNISAITFNEFMKLVKKLDTIEILIAEISYKYKKYIFEPWYSEIIVSANGIWIGPGVTDQSVIRVTDLNKKYRVNVNNDNAWIFKNGSGNVIKLITQVGDNNEE